MLFQHQTLTPCWFNVGPASLTPAQHWTNMGRASGVCSARMCVCVRQLVAALLRQLPPWSWGASGVAAVPGRVWQMFVAEEDNEHRAVVGHPPDPQSGFTEWTVVHIRVWVSRWTFTVYVSMSRCVDADGSCTPPEEEEETLPETLLGRQQESLRSVATCWPCHSACQSPTADTRLPRQPQQPYVSR